ncbi:MAG: 23S rRNA (pseudouridine(1915)-N(3))-methyltransferase RlmH [Muribaculaceae bacterium]|nr:23S rRNA (pseudouridine(1915)-N(3))-methyltransferase RlmH [Muribaculaceae bacterium]
MEINLLSIGKISSEWIQKGLENFESRIGKYIKYSTTIIPDIRNSKALNSEQQKEEEGRAIINRLQPSDFVVIMDERGLEQTSREFASWLQRQMNTGRKRIVLIIGGPFGFSDDVYRRADCKLSLSKMTFTHEMAKLFLTEQIYRAMTILRGEPYHHD